MGWHQFPPLKSINIVIFNQQQQQQQQQEHDQQILINHPTIDHPTIYL